MFSPRQPMLAKLSGACSNGHDEVARGMPPELHVLRRMIRQDVKDLLQAELSNLCSGLGNGKSSKGGTSPSAPTVLQQDLPPPLPGAPCSEYTPLAEWSAAESEGCYQHKSRSKDSVLFQPSWVSSTVLKSISRKIHTSKGKYTVQDDESTKLFGEIESLSSEVPEGSCRGRLLDGVRWFVQLEEPEREGCFADLERSKPFQVTFISLVLLNAIFMVFQVNQGIENPGSDPEPHMVVIENAFLALFAIELTVKMIVHKIFFFWCDDLQWNILDFGLVVFGVGEVVVQYLVGGSKKGPTWLRSLRLFRVAKVLRVLRVVRAFKQLDLIMKCLIGSFMALLWSVLMLFIMYYVFSLTLAQQAVAYLIENDGQDDDLVNVFGSVEACMFALFQTTFGADGWALYYPQAYKMGLIAQGVWIFYVLFTQIAVVNVLTAIFVESALVLAEGTPKEKALKHEEQLKEDARELRNLCEAGDIDCNGLLSRQEFEHMLSSDGDFSRYLHYIGLDTTHVHTLFDVIRGESEEGVDIATLVSGILQLKGSARSSDLIVLMQELKNVERVQERQVHDIATRLATLKESMERPASHASWPRVGRARGHA